MTDLDRTIIFIFMLLAGAGIWMTVRSLADIHGHVSRIEEEIEGGSIPQRVRDSADSLREEIRKYLKK